MNGRTFLTMLLLGPFLMVTVLLNWRAQPLGHVLLLFGGGAAVTLLWALGPFVWWRHWARRVELPSGASRRRTVPWERDRCDEA